MPDIGTGKTKNAAAVPLIIQLVHWKVQGELKSSFSRHLRQKHLVSHLSDLTAVFNLLHSVFLQSASFDVLFGRLCNRSFVTADFKNCCHRHYNISMSQ